MAPTPSGITVPLPDLSPITDALLRFIHTIVGVICTFLNAPMDGMRALARGALVAGHACAQAFQDFLAAHPAIGAFFLSAQEVVCGAALATKEFVLLHPIAIGVVLALLGGAVLCCGFWPVVLFPVVAVRALLAAVWNIVQPILQLALNAVKIVLQAVRYVGVGLLRILGFGAKGIIVDTPAALFQSVWYGAFVPAGSFFARLTSCGARIAL